MKFKALSTLSCSCALALLVGCSNDNTGSTTTGGSSNAGGQTSAGATTGGAVASGGNASGGSTSGGSTSGGSTSGGSTSGGSTSGGSTSGGSTSGGSGAAAGTPAFVGDFTIELKADSEEKPTYATFIGRANDGPTPPQVPLKVAQLVGDCELRIPDVPFCDPKCEDGVCTAENTCTRHPTGQNLGDLTVKGIGQGPLVIEGTPPSYSYSSGEALPNPPCTEGAEFSIESAALSITGRCIAPLTLGGADPVLVRAGKTVDLVWEAAKNPAQSRIEIYLDIAHHGGKKGQINCDVPDTGSFSIPEPLVTQLVNLGIAGFPTITITRASTATIPAHPQLRLRMVALITREVDTGIASCNETTPCPNGQVCDEDFYTCR